MLQIYTYRFRTKINFNSQQNLDLGLCNDLNDLNDLNDINETTNTENEKELTTNSDPKNSKLTDLGDLGDVLREMESDFRTDYYFDPNFLSILHDIRFGIGEVEDQNKKGDKTIMLSIDVDCSRSLDKKERNNLRSITWEFLKDIDDTYYIHEKKSEKSEKNLYLSFGGCFKNRKNKKGRSAKET